MHASILERIPGVRYLFFVSRNRGWPYVIAWLHRISGVLLLAYAWLHIKTLSNLHNQEIFEQVMRSFSSLPMIVEWSLAVPVIVHALNGGRIILYEVFGVRQDRQLITWISGERGFKSNFCGMRSEHKLMIVLKTFWSSSW